MHHCGFTAAGNVDQLFDIQVSLCRAGPGNAQLHQCGNAGCRRPGQHRPRHWQNRIHGRPDNANRNFAPVRDEHFVWGTVATALIIYTPSKTVKAGEWPESESGSWAELARNIKMVVGDSTNHRVTTG